MSESRRASRQVGSVGSQQQDSGAAPATETEELVLTLDKATQAVVKIARIDPGGQRHALSEEDSAELVDRQALRELLFAIDQAYRAGLTEGLKSEGAEADADDDVLVRLLVSGSVEPDIRELGVGAMLLRPLLLRRLLRQHVESALKTGQERRTPIVDSPRNGSASKI